MRKGKINLFELCNSKKSRRYFEDINGNWYKLTDITSFQRFGTFVYLKGGISIEVTKRTMARICKQHYSGMVQKLYEVIADYK